MVLRDQDMGIWVLHLGLGGQNLGVLDLGLEGQVLGLNAHSNRFYIRICDLIPKFG